MRVSFLPLAAVCAFASACASTQAPAAPRAPVIRVNELDRAAPHDGLLSIAAYVTLADLVEFAQARTDLSSEEKAALRARSVEVFEKIRDPAPYIMPVATVPDWVLAGSGAFVTERGERVFVGVGTIALDRSETLAENLARAELSTMLQRIWDEIVPPSDYATRASWVAEVPVQVGTTTPPR